MKITRRQLRQIIKEELSRLNESKGEDYFDGKSAEAIAGITDALAQIAQKEDIKISQDSMRDILGVLNDGSWKVAGKTDPLDGLPWDEHSASIDWNTEGLADVLEDAGVPADTATQMVDDLSFFSTVGVPESSLDNIFGQGSLDNLEIGDAFTNVSELSKIISQRTEKPASKKEYNGPKGKGQTRYIVTSQMTKWHSEDEADFTQSWFSIVDTTDGSEFKLKGSELPHILPSTEGQIEIFDIASSSDRDESNLVAGLNDKEFHLVRKDI